jgi:hypothetical protein
MTYYDRMTYYDEFITEIETSIGLVTTVLEWWETDRQRLISHMVGACSVISKYRNGPRISREQVVKLIELYLGVGPYARMGQRRVEDEEDGTQ